MFLCIKILGFCIKAHLYYAALDNRDFLPLLRLQKVVWNQFSI